MKLSPPLSLQEDTYYRVLRMLASNPAITQRELAHELGVSVGKVNYCVKALVDNGWIKARNFKNSNNKAAYFYLLTPKGVKQKARLATRFLRKKLEEYNALKREISLLNSELNPKGEPKVFDL